jgi:hypothetical protein
MPEEPVIRSVVSLTRGPSQGAGADPQIRSLPPAVTLRPIGRTG